LLSDEEKQQLINVAQSVLTDELEDEIEKIEEEDREIKQKIEIAKSKLKDSNAKS
jgi:hypothetical protein